MCGSAHGHLFISKLSNPFRLKDVSHDTKYCYNEKTNCLLHALALLFFLLLASVVAAAAAAEDKQAATQHNKQ